MGAQAGAAQAYAERTLSRPPQTMLDGYESTARDAASSCQVFTARFKTYMNDYGNEGYAYLWNRCDSERGARPCAVMRLWLQTHR